MKDYALLNLYAPSGSDKKFDRAIFFSQDVFRAFNLHPDSYWIVGGDFNCVLQPIDVENILSSELLLLLLGCTGFMFLLVS